MEAALLKSVLAGTAPDAKVVIQVLRPGSMGGTPCVSVASLNVGFDWDNGKLMLVPEHPLTQLTAEDVAAIRESVSRGQSWHAYEAHKKQKALIDSYKVDAERYRFATAISTNEALWPSLLPLVTAAGCEELSGPMTPESLAELHDNQMKVAIKAGLWPMKAEGEPA